ncbi:unnamed protein product [Sphagnum jensenii]|uniref:Uncharacterized protein n=1 Tax=Sphagnum jensenii TaxID=128206 RepID=A0ABP0WKA4_9BRYO
MPSCTPTDAHNEKIVRARKERRTPAHPSIARPGTGVTCEFLLRGAGPASGPSWWGTVAALVAWGSTPQVALQPGSWELQVRDAE